MKTLISITALALAGGLMFAHAPTAEAQSGYLRCASRVGTEAFCPVDTSRGVRLVQQLSRAGCWEGRTWGKTRRGVWVANGCRADFEVGTYRKAPIADYNAGPNANVTALALGILGMTAIGARQDRDRTNDYGYDYGYQNRIYSRYDTYRDNYWRSSYSQPDLVRCESVDGRLRTCGTGIDGRVELVRQLSDQPCRFRMNWGYDSRGIWVDRGCRADFRVY